MHTPACRALRRTVITAPSMSLRRMEYSGASSSLMMTIQKLTMISDGKFCIQKAQRCTGRQGIADVRRKREGFGGHMVKSVEFMLVDAGYLGIHTDTSLENGKMQYLFEKQGFEFRGRLHLDENEDDWYVAYEKVFKMGE